MVRCAVRAGMVILTAWLITAICSPGEALAAGNGQPTDWGRFYRYHYVYYPHNFLQPQGSYNHMYYRYAPNQRIPVYNKDWYNFYPTEKPYYRGHHFILDVF